MIGYASRTGTRRNLDALRSRGWGLLVSPTGEMRTEGFEQYYNGAWTAHQQGTEWGEGAFVSALDKVGKEADFVVTPDIVCGGERSLELSLRWLSRCLDGCQRALLAVQDGFTAEMIEEHLSPKVGVFVGGSTEWKEKSLPLWGELCQRKDAWFHVGRVNSVRRIKLCLLAGATSFDGSSASRFSVELPKLDHARRLGVLPGIS